MKTQDMDTFNRLTSKNRKRRPLIALSSSFGASENINKQRCNSMSEMVLSDGTTLEMIVAGEEEVKIAIENARNNKLVDKIEDAKEIDELSPVIEQQLDPQSYESTDYRIETPYASSSYDGEKNYYQLTNSDGGTIGASFTSVMSEYEHETLEQAQNIQNNTREGDQTSNPFVEPQIDMNQKYIKESVKLVSPALWQVMYYGKIKFN